ncbi:MAG: FHA domain-containing protein, partial [Cyanobacteria bacterium J06650_10]
QTTQINQSTTTSFVSGRQYAILQDAENPGEPWTIYSDVLKIGRRPDGNDVVIADPWVSSSHAEIFNRRVSPEESTDGRRMAYFLRDKSRYGTFYMEGEDWREVHRQEVPLRSGTKIRFGSRSEGQMLEFVLKDA